MLFFAMLYFLHSSSQFSRFLLEFLESQHKDVEISEQRVSFNFDARMHFEPSSRLSFVLGYRYILINYMRLSILHNLHH